MYEREEEHLATPAEAVAEYARNIGGEYPDRAWLLHDWDVWVANPHYVGPPVMHPEMAMYEDEMLEREAEMAAAFGPVVLEIEPWDTDGDTSKWNENGESSEAENDRWATRTFKDDVPF